MINKKLNIYVFGEDSVFRDVINLDFLLKKNIEIKYYYNYQNLFKNFDNLNNNDENWFFFIGNIFIKLEGEKINYNNFFEQLKNIKTNNKKSKFINIDLLYPSIENKNILEELKEKYLITIQETKYGNFTNRIQEPILGILNFQNIWNEDFIGELYFSTFFMITNDEFVDRKYDIMMNIGKPREHIRQLLILLMSKIKNEKIYSNCSFSNECRFDKNTTYDDLINEFNFYKNSILYGLDNYFKKIKFCTHIHSHFYKSKINYQNTHGKVGDFSSYAQIYTESLTCQDYVLKKWPELISYSEKTFSNFYSYKIPIPIDTEENINYLKNLGFKFPIKPFFIKPNCEINEYKEDLEVYLKELQKTNIKDLWFDFIKDPNSPLHNNYKILKSYMFENGKSNPLSFLITYKILFKLKKQWINNLIKFDNQTYCFLKNKKLIK